MIRGMSETRRTAATIADVARLAGVGRGTVSRVLNDRPNVDPRDARARPGRIRELNYVPSAAARRLSLGRTHTIAVVVPYLTRASVVERLRGIEQALAKAGLDMIVFNVETPQRRDEVLRDLPRPARVDGLILVSIAPHEHELRRIRASGLPLVLVDAHHRSVPRVVVDDVGGGRLAARHLLDLGHLRIGFVGDPMRPPIGFASSRLRLTRRREGPACRQPRDPRRARRARRTRPPACPRADEPPPSPAAPAHRDCRRERYAGARRPRSRRRPWPPGPR